MLKAHSRIQGEIRCVLLGEDGRTVVHDTGWFPNLLTNQGLINMFEGWATNFNLGTSATAPQYTDTALFGWLYDLQGSATVSTLGVAPNWEFSTTYKARFNAGIATGLLQEIGFNYSSYTNNTKMSIRALLSPAINKASNQILDVYYKLTRWPDLVDRTGVVSIGGVDYNYIVRGKDYGTGSTDPGSNSFVNAFGLLGVRNVAVTATCYSDEISTINSGPAVPVSASPNSTEITLENNGSGYADYHLVWGLDNGNGNIRTITCREAGHNTGAPRGWQIRLGKVSDDSPLVKVNTKELHLDFRVTWSRYP